MTSSAPSGRRAIWPRRIANSPGQAVFSGTPEASRGAWRRRSGLGAKRAAARVSAAFHSPLMEAAARDLGAALDRVEFSRGRFPVWANVSAAPVREPEDARVAPIAAPHAGALGADDARADRSGIRRFVEVGNGRVLRGLARSVDKELALFGSQDSDEAEAAASASRPRRDDGALRDTRRGRHRRRQGSGSPSRSGSRRRGRRSSSPGRDGAALESAAREVRDAGRGAPHRGGRRRRGRGRAGRRGDDRAYGRADILVNNAGVTRDGLLLRMSDEDWDVVLETNLKGAFRMIRAFARPM